MASKKTEIKNVELFLDDDKELSVKYQNEDGEDVEQTLELLVTEAYTKAGGSEENKIHLDITIKPHSDRKAPERKPKVEFVCPQCGSSIKVSEDRVEDITFHCNRCDCDYEVQE